MKKLYDYITEKLLINKNTKISKNIFEEVKIVFERNFKKDKLHFNNLHEKHKMISIHYYVKESNVMGHKIRKVINELKENFSEISSGTYMYFNSNTPFYYNIWITLK